MRRLGPILLALGVLITACGDSGTSPLVVDTGQTTSSTAVGTTTSSTASTSSTIPATTVPPASTTTAPPPTTTVPATTVPATTVPPASTTTAPATTTTSTTEPAPIYHSVFSGPVYISEGEGVRFPDGSMSASVSGDIWFAFGEFGFRGNLWFQSTERPDAETCGGEPGNLSSSPIGTGPLTLVTGWWACIQLPSTAIGTFRIGQVGDDHVFGYLETWVRNV